MKPVPKDHGYLERSQSPHRLVIPFTALLAVVLTVALFQAFYETLGASRAVYASASIAFLATALIGIIFKPLLGE